MTFLKYIISIRNSMWFYSIFWHWPICYFCYGLTKKSSGRIGIAWNVCAKAYSLFLSLSLSRALKRWRKASNLVCGYILILMPYAEYLSLFVFIHVSFDFIHLFLHCLLAALFEIKSSISILNILYFILGNFI